jgi:hypothetical protein
MDILKIKEEKRQVTQQEAEDLAKKEGCIYVGECSSLMNQNVNEAMQALYEQIFFK